MCSACGFDLRVENGIWQAIPPERLARFSQFIADYENVRQTEGRGSDDPAYYLALPFKDLTGKNSGQWEIRARTFEFLRDHILTELPAHSSILDLGAGNGWFSYRLARAGQRPVAVDLLTNSFDGLSAASAYFPRLHEPFPRFRAEFARLPFASGTFDAAIFNASFHYSEDYAATLAEALRCLRPGGLIAICDTAWYSAETSGLAMLRERESHFKQRFGFASNSIESQEFLTDERLESLARKLRIYWTRYTPEYGFAWRIRPLLAKLRGRREPSRFHIHVARVPQ